MNPVLHVFAGPTFYDIAEEGTDAGAGTTISIGTIIRARRIFGGGALAIQQLDDPLESRSPLISTNGSLEEPRDNHYINGLLGFVLPDGRTSLGVAAARARRRTRATGQSAGLPRLHDAVLDRRAARCTTLAVAPELRHSAMASMDSRFRRSRPGVTGCPCLRRSAPMQPGGHR